MIYISRRVYDFSLKHSVVSTWSENSLFECVINYSVSLVFLHLGALPPMEQNSMWSDQLFQERSRGRSSNRRSRKFRGQKSSRYLVSYLELQRGWNHPCSLTWRSQQSFQSPLLKRNPSKTGKKSARFREEILKTDISQHPQIEPMLGQSSKRAIERSKITTRH